MTTENENSKSKPLPESDGSQSKWEQRCRLMATELHRILIAQKILRPSDIMLPELLMHGRDYADFLEGINSEND